jgi:glyoxylase-like metal-dependent hydrolase (beta-lactamase superfamily II)
LAAGLSAGAHTAKVEALRATAAARPDPPRPASAGACSRRCFLNTSTAALGGAAFSAWGFPSSGALSAWGRPSGGPGEPFAAQQAARITATDLGGATLFQGAGCNVLALPGPDGALMIDGGLAANADALLEAVMIATKAARIHTLINTHGHPEQVGANEAVGRAGGVIFAHEKTKQYLSNSVDSVTFTGRRRPLPEAARPTKTTRADGSMEWPAPSERSGSSGQQLDYGYLPAAHTDGDLFIHLPKMNLLVAGGVVSAEAWPLIDHRNGAWLGGRVRALERLADLVEPDTRVVPADGRTMTGKDIVRHRDIYRKLFATMIDYLNMGLGPEDAVTRNPLKEYGSEFGDPSAFTYGALRSMMIAYVPD